MLDPVFKAFTDVIFEGCAPAEVTRGGRISRGLILTESGRNGRGHDSSLSHRSCCWELSWTAALCDTLFSGQRTATERNHVLKCATDGGTLSFSVQLTRVSCSKTQAIKRHALPSLITATQGLYFCHHCNDNIVNRLSLTITSQCRYYTMQGYTLYNRIFCKNKKHIPK